MGLRENFYGAFKKAYLRATSKAAQERVQETKGTRANWFVEVEEPITARDMDEETQGAITALRGNIGFEALVRKLNLQKAALRSRLENTRHLSQEDYIWLQAGVYWLGYINREVAQQVALKELKDARRAAPKQYEEQFNRVRAALQLVGLEEEDG